ncbi:n-alpha-acetyltransferase 25, NatB auxiliary subunit [Trichonephila clavata]|uniref:N-terminal acetyltransferase B complex subunit MDM20 homolog n=1 Tax=Trichonephila clavata TaxID=2740835 RepID=A0A8X6K5K2_TRICU|nr:n-alpha-acetyltransferase 25, NatB auxiliary subunit [Trichonephila clavata]
MAARSYVDSGVNERRLRPIYDCLDIGNNKKALQESDKLLKKQKDFLCAKALKSLALVRLGRSEESFNTIQEVHAEGPTDDPTLQAMTICYRELQKLELIADAYERATRKDPQNEELLSHLFMSHVRNGDYKKQQQTAMALYKLKPKNPYYFWAVMSIVMQADVADENLAKSMLLPLAERMTEKFVNEGKLEAEAEVQLYLMILERQGKYEKAIEVLEGPLREKLSPYQDTLEKRTAEYLAKLEKWPETNQAYKKLILGNPDQWSYYKEYFNSVYHLVDSNWTPQENGHEKFEDAVDYDFQKAIDFIEALVEEQNGTRDGRKLRGPYLAQIKLLDELIRRNNPVSKNIGSMADVLVKFYEQFGTKPSCFIDLSYIMGDISLKEEEIKPVLEKIKASLVLENGTENITLPKDVKQMNRHLCYSRLHHYYGCHLDWDTTQQLTYARELIERYHHALQFGTNLLTTEFQPADNYCLLAAHMLISIWEKTGDERFIGQVLVVLENGLKSSPSNYQIKLLLMKVYNIIGAVGASFNLYESIEVKHVQQETLGYLITDSLQSAGLFNVFHNVVASSIRFYTTNYKDIVDYLLSGYKFGSFTKIPELVEFREKINNSLHYASVSIERLILDLLHEPKSYQDLEKLLSSLEIDPEKDNRPTNDLVDNRDIFIYRMYTEKEKFVLDEHVPKSRQEKIWWLKIRNLILRLIAATFYLYKPNYANDTENNITNGEKRHMINILTDLIASIKDSVAAINKENMINSIFPVQSPGISRLYKYLRDSHLDTLIAFAKLVQNVHGLVEGYTTDKSENKDDFEVVNIIKNNFQDSLKRLQEINQNKDSLSPTLVKIFLEDLMNTVETLSLGIIFVSLCHAMLKPMWSSVIKRGKKKKENIPAITQATFQQLTNLINDMESVGSSLQDLVDEIVPSQLVLLKISSLTENDNSVQNQENIVREITCKVEDSYQTSIKDLSNLVYFKVKYLQSLKW